MSALYEEPRFVVVGQTVIAPYEEAGGMTIGLKCKVRIACGDAAQVVNERRGFERRFRLDSLRVEKKP